MVEDCSVMGRIIINLLDHFHTALNATRFGEARGSKNKNRGIIVFNFENYLFNPGHLFEGRMSGASDRSPIRRFWGCNPLQGKQNALEIFHTGG